MGGSRASRSLGANSGLRGALTERWQSGANTFEDSLVRGFRSTKKIVKPAGVSSRSRCAIYAKGLEQHLLERKSPRLMSPRPWSPSTKHRQEVYSDLPATAASGSIMSARLSNSQQFNATGSKLFDSTSFISAGVRSTEFDSLLLRRAVCEIQRRVNGDKPANKRVSVNAHDPDKPPDTLTAQPTFTRESSKPMSLQGQSHDEMQRLLSICTLTQKNAQRLAPIKDGSRSDSKGSRSNSKGAP